MAAELTISRAHISGLLSRDQLAAILSSAATNMPPLSPDELLYIPHMAPKAKLQSGSTNKGFADQVVREIGELCYDAAYNPVGISSARAYRFSSKTAFHAWLIGRWIDGGEAAIAPIVKAMSGQNSPYHWLRREILTNGRMLPRLIALLESCDHALAFAALLSPNDAVVAIMAMGQAYAFDPQKAVQAEESVHAQKTSIAQHKIPLSRLTAPLITTALWPRLFETQKRLLVLALDIGIRPSVIRTAPYFRALTQIMLDAAASPSQTKDSAAPNSAAPISSQDNSISRIRAEAHIYKSRKSAKTGTPILGQATKSISAPLSQDSATLAAKKLCQSDNEPSSLEEGAYAVPDAGDAAAPDTQILRTQYGGLFFLINALLAMGLYPDFTQQLGSRLAIAPLRLIDRIAMRHFGSQYRRDPMHKLLRVISANGALPTIWQVRAEWLNAFDGAAKVTKHIGGRRVTQWHSSGFPLSDRNLRAGHDLLYKTQSTPPILPSSRDARWIACLTHYLEARIRRATGPANLGLDALEMPAEIQLIDDQIMIRFELTDLPLALRLAGLDRNPGWLPAEGRSVAFEFL